MYPITPDERVNPGLKDIVSRSLSFAFLALVLLMTTITGQAQTAAISGALSNFDVVNNTGQDAHGFEIEFEGLQPGDVYYTFNLQRYGAPEISQSATGVVVRWTSLYDFNGQQFLQTTVAHKPNTPFAGTCYQWGGSSYASSGCEHFGVTLSANALKTTYRWLVEDPQTPGTLVAVALPVAIPSPTYVVLPPARPADPPVLEATIEATEPAESPELYGNAQWVKVFKTELQRSVTLEELVSDNATVPQNAAQVEVAWEIIQTEPVSNSNGNRRRRQNQGSLNPDTRAVVRRYEIYEYTGAYDPVTHEALCADGLCNAPQDGEVGDFVGAQMAAANVTVPAVTISKTGNGNVSSSDRVISCGSKCAASYNAGALVTLVASPSSGSAFVGWGGACAGNQLTCTVTVNESLDVTATFAPQYTLSVSGGKLGTVASDSSAIDCGKICSAKITQGTNVTLTATPAVGAKFLGWTGACTGTSLTCTVRVTNDTKVQASFK
ncbi:MAG TPA: hypothetical protein VEV81_11485 [Pyrinomonadaceae bacterium]|nr:hypothetical protein [Pyrinomonadaceae bacterium]